MLAMKTESVWLTPGDGTRIHMKVHSPDGAPLGCIAMVHGVGEHTGRYERVARYFCEKGYLFTVHDQRGHGATPGKRGLSPSYATLIDDIDLVLSWIAKKHPDLPVCLYGHSLGGNLVLHRVLRGNLPTAVRCAVAGSPWLTLHAPPGRMTVTIARLVSRLSPTFTAKNDLDVDDLTRSAEVRAETKSDKDYHYFIGARLFEEITVAGQAILSGPPDFGIPLYVMVGTKDLIVSHESVLEFIALCGGRCESKVWEDLYHELHNEPEANEVLGTVVDFLGRHMASAAEA
jgi:alpha-beta hydrolase superfamily lysophospholipase